MQRTTGVAKQVEPSRQLGIADIAGDLFEPKWPLRKTVLFVVLGSSALWIGISYLIWRLFT